MRRRVADGDDGDEIRALRQCGGIDRVACLIRIADGEGEAVCVGFLTAFGGNAFGDKTGEERGLSGVPDLQRNGRCGLVEQGLCPDVLCRRDILRLACGGIGEVHGGGRLVALHIAGKGDEAEGRLLCAEPVVGGKRLRDSIGQTGGRGAFVNQAERHQADGAVAEVAAEGLVVLRVGGRQLRCLGGQLACDVRPSDKGVGGGQQPAAHGLKRLALFQAVHRSHFGRSGKGEDVEAVGLCHFFGTFVIGCHRFPAACRAHEVTDDAASHGIGHEVAPCSGLGQEMRGVDRSPSVAACPAGPVGEGAIYRLVGTQAADDFFHGVFDGLFFVGGQRGKFIQI